jgi:hypothetical protein
MKYNENIHEDKHEDKDDDSIIDMDELEQLIGNDPGSDSESLPDNTTEEIIVDRYLLAPQEERDKQEEKERKIIEEQEEARRKLFNRESYVHINPDLDTDPNIPIVSGTSATIPPLEIERNLKVIDYDWVDGYPYDIHHYFYKRKHTYSIRIDKRKRAKYSHDSSDKPPKIKRYSELTRHNMEMIREAYVDPFVCEVPVPQFPIHDEATAQIEETHRCITISNGFKYEAREMFKFPHVPVDELRSLGIGISTKVGKHPLPIKDIVWRATGRDIPKGQEVYPGCGNAECFRLDHLRLCTEKEYIDLNNSAGSIYYIEYVDGATTQEIYTCCQDRAHRKKMYVHVSDGNKLQYPFDFEEGRIDIFDSYDRKSEIPAMRITVEEAGDLLKRFIRPQTEYKHKLEITIGNQKETKEYQEYARCLYMKHNDHIYTHKVGDIEFDCLKIPNDLGIYKYVKRLPVKDIVWRAHGHEITKSEKVYTVCQDIKCSEYNHLVLENKHYHGTRTKSCGFILGLKDSDLLFVISHCKHDKKCRVPIVVQPKLYGNK